MLRALLWSSPATLVYLVVIPLVALRLDGWLELPELPGWCRWPALLLLPAGLGVALWTVWLFAVDGHGTPNPVAPPQRLVVRGPYRCSRNPMMLGGWVAGLGLALVLGSPSLLVGVALLVAAGVAYVRLIEEPVLRKRFGESYRRREDEIPRWLGFSRACTKR
jgi:protein-S-isoprenylcysteine O-methyltransferase Ste14